MTLKSLSSPALLLLAVSCVLDTGAWAARHPHARRRHRAQTQRAGHTYRNPDYGFTIASPPAIKPVNRARGGGAGGFIPLCDDTTIACFAYTGHAYDGTNFDGAGLAINVIRDATSEQACRNLESERNDSSPPVKVTIHGTQFEHARVAEGATSHSLAGDSYRVFRQGVCFEMTTGIGSFSIAALEDPSTVKKFKPARLEALLRDMAHTFRFVGPVKYGAAWKVSRDSGCGGTYEYPADAAAEIVVDNVGNLSNSDRITCSRSFTFGGRRYTLDVKSDPVDDAWLRSRGYPALKDATMVGKSDHYIDYRAGSYYYVHGQAQLFIFSVSDASHRAIDPGDDPVYRHWLSSFKTSN